LSIKYVHAYSVKYITCVVSHLCSGTVTGSGRKGYSETDLPAVLGVSLQHRPALRLSDSFERRFTSKVPPDGVDL